MDPVFNTQASRIAEKVARPRAFPSRILLLNVQKILSTKAVEHFSGCESAPQSILLGFEGVISIL